MARTNSVNFTGGLQYPMADAATDLFKKEDVQVLAKAVDQHDHSTGKGLVLPASAIPPITSAMIADGAITATDIGNQQVGNPQIADNAIFGNKIAASSIVTTQIQDAAVTNAKIGPSVERWNYLLNPAFAIWQRGNGAFTQGAKPCADRWFLLIGGSSTMSVSKGGLNGGPGGSGIDTATCSVTWNNGDCQLYQHVPFSAGDIPATSYLRGRTVTFSINIYVGSGNVPGVYLFTDGTGGTATGGNNAIAGQWTICKVTAPIPTDATYVRCAVYFSQSVPTAYVTQA